MKPLFSLLLLVLVFFNSGIQAQNSKKEWSFTNQENGLKKHYKQGEKIVVKWRGESRTISSKGLLVDIQTDSLLLMVDKQVHGIAKKDIQSIRKFKPGPALIFLGALLALAGIAIMFYFIVNQLVYNATRTDRQLASGEQKRYWPGAFLGVGVIALAFMSQRLPTAGLKQPFGANWSIQEKVEQPKEMP